MALRAFKFASPWAAMALAFFSDDTDISGAAVDALISGPASKRDNASGPSLGLPRQIQSVLLMRAVVTVPLRQ